MVKDSLALTEHVYGKIDAFSPDAGTSALKSLTSTEI